jgi:Uma2 family endonuclease
MTSIQSPPKLSLAEFLELPETEPASEYIDGNIYQKPMPKGKHSRVQIRLGTQINQIAEPDRIASAFTVFSWQRIPLDAKGEIENTFEINPDWTIEILSPEQSPTRVIDKILFCLNHGTELGWLIDPQEKLVMIFKPGKQPEIKQDGDMLPVLSSLEDLLQDIFNWLTLN